LGEKKKDRGRAGGPIGASTGRGEKVGIAKTLRSRDERLDWKGGRRVKKELRIGLAVKKGRLLLARGNLGRRETEKKGMETYVKRLSVLLMKERQQPA